MINYRATEFAAATHDVDRDTIKGDGMQFVRYLAGGEARYGVLEGSQVLSATGDPFSGLTPGAAVGSVESLTLLPPVHPGKIVAVGLNYVDHVKEGGRDRDVPDEPVIFMKPQSALIGNGETIQLPMDTENIHYEAELAVVIGKRARRVSEADAYDYVLGLTCGNDVSARILQAKDGQWTRAKGFDTFLPLGPVVNVGLRADDLAVQSRLNGEVRQSARTSQMIFSVPKLIAFISRVMTLDPGDVIITGTPAGVGPMKPGDTIEVEVEGIGVLRNPVAAESV
jgi:2-keto-4-pentenoate hydratase/2-oxohepta-3-ene-1,7-dioic acid hydratase in catechol pathway